MEHVLFMQQRQGMRSARSTYLCKEPCANPCVWRGWVCMTGDCRRTSGDGTLSPPLLLFGRSPTVLHGADLVSMMTATLSLHSNEQTLA